MEQEIQDEIIEKEIPTRKIYVEIVENKLTTRWSNNPYEDFTEIEILKDDFQGYNDTMGLAFELQNGIAIKVRDIELCKNEIIAKNLKQENTIKEIVNLENWFIDYDRKVSEHLRCERLKTVCHHKIEELDAEAVIKQSRLKELREAVHNEI